MTWRKKGEKTKNKRRKILKKVANKNKKCTDDSGETIDIKEKIKEYLLSFDAKTNWKFNKITQKAVFNHMYDKEKVIKIFFLFL